MDPLLSFSITNLDNLADQANEEATIVARQVRSTPKGSKRRKLLEHLDTLHLRISELSKGMQQGHSVDASRLEKLQRQLNKIDRRVKTHKTRLGIEKLVTECQSNIKQLLSPENRLKWAKEATERQEESLESREIRSLSTSGHSGLTSWLLHGLQFIGSMGWLPDKTLRGETTSMPVVTAAQTSIIADTILSTDTPVVSLNVTHVSRHSLSSLHPLLEKYEETLNDACLSEEECTDKLKSIENEVEKIASQESDLNTKLESADPLILVDLVRKGRLSLAKILLNHRINPNQKDPTGTPLLHLAMKLDNKNERHQLVETLIHAGVDMHGRDAQGKTAIEFLMDVHDKSPNKKDAQLLVHLYIHGASLSEQQEQRIIELALVVSGPSTLNAITDRIKPEFIDSLQKKGVSVVSEFIKQADDSPDILKKLIAKGLDIHQLDGTGKSALYHACLLQKPLLARALWKEGLALSVKERSLLIDESAKNRFIAKWVRDFGSPYTQPESVQVQPLPPEQRERVNEAISSNNISEINLLLDQGIDIECLHEALKTRNEHTILVVLSKFIASGQNLDVPDNQGNTALHTAVLMDQHPIVEALIASGANVNSQNKRGTTPLSDALDLHSDALELHSIESIQLLLEGGAATHTTIPFTAVFSWEYPKTLSLTNIALATLSYKALGHAFELRHHVEIQSNQYMSLEGGESYYFSSEMLGAFQDLREKYGLMFSEQENRELSALLKLGEEGSTVEERIHNIRRNVTTAMHGGFADHAVEINIYKGQYLIISNKGAASERPVSVYKIDPDKITTDTILDIFDRANYDDEEDYINWVQNLDKELGATQDPLTKLVSASYPLFPYQTVGNCAWESVETSVFAIIAMERLSQHDWASGPPNPKIIKNIQETFINWLTFTQLYTLDKHLTLYEQDSALHTLVPMDHHVMHAVFRKARVQKSTLKGLNDRLEQLEERYLALAEKSHAESEKQNFKIGRIWDQTLGREPSDSHEKELRTLAQAVRAI